MSTVTCECIRFLNFQGPGPRSGLFFAAGSQRGAMRFLIFVSLALALAGRAARAPGQFLQKSLKRSGAISVYLTVC